MGKKLKTLRISNKWTCSMCTFENDHSFKKCQMCETKNPQIQKSEEAENKKTKSTKNKLQKQVSIVDLTQNESSKPNKKNRKKSKKKIQPKISNLNGTRSRTKYFEKLTLTKTKKSKTKKKKLSHIESIESIKGSIQKTKKSSTKKSDHISDDCKIISSKKRKSKQIKALETEQWIDKYAPHKIEDLYLQKNKLQKQVSIVDLTQNESSKPNKKNRK